MTMTQSSTTVGVFTNRDQANQAIDALRGAGFGYDRIRLVERGTGNFLDTLKSLFTGQEATTSNAPTDLMKMGMPEQDAHYYQNELDAGSVIVIINADERPEQAFSIMRQNGAYDVSAHLRVAQNAPVGAYNSSTSRQTYNPNAPTGAYNTNMPNTQPGTPSPNVPPPNYNPNVQPPTYNPNAPAGTYNPNVPPDTRRNP